MLLAILETGEPPEALRSAYPDYGAMMERMLAPVAPRLSFARWRALDGDVPRASEADAILITGSAAGAYDGHHWIAPLEDLIRAAAAARKPQVGICFGHQVMAQAFGGEVAKSDKGWGVGVHDYDVVAQEPWMAPATGRVACVVSHQDQVTTTPPSARVVARSDFCPHAFLAYDHAPAMSMQPHPEFDHDYAAALYARRRGRMGEALVDEALGTLKKRVDRELLARWIATFLQTAR
ncbi:MAG: gamma-glutamyl-gamma-aminobutyrate hydrolase family protein [Parvularculaceae bacterium]